MSSKGISAVRMTVAIAALMLLACGAEAADGDFAWAKRMGGTSEGLGEGIALDGAGNVYITGAFQGTADFDPGPGTFNLTSAGNWDIFVSKLDSVGGFVWAKRMGGSGIDRGKAIAVDGAGNVYITGHFADTVDFDPGPGTLNQTSAGHDDIFVSKLDSAGEFVWAKRMGGVSQDAGCAIALDAAGNVHTTGVFNDTADFDPGSGTFDLISVDYREIFVSKLDSVGDLVWAKAIGGTGDDIGLGIAVDGAGNVCTTGEFDGTVDFDPGAGTYTLTSEGNDDIFISMLDEAGAFLWARAMGGTAYDYGIDVTVDDAGNVYTTGFFYGTVDLDPGPGTFELTTAGDRDVFVSKLDSVGDFAWAKAMGGTAVDRGISIAMDVAGNVYTTGYFNGTVDFDPGPGTFDLSSAGDREIFVSKLDSAGDFEWAKSMGGASEDDGWSVAVDSAGNVYTTGYFNGTADFDPGPGTFNLSSAGLRDIFVSKLFGPGFWNGFTAEPQDARAYNGEPHTFTVAVDCGPGTLSYQWKWNDGAKNIHDVGTDAASYAIPDVTGKAGDYWCEVTYDGSTYPSAAATLEVEDHLAIDVQPMGGSYTVGDSHTFTVGTSGGYAPLTYTWKKDGDTVGTDASLVLDPLQLAHSGNYTVEVIDDNVDVAISSPAAALTVEPGVPAASGAFLAVLTGLTALAAARRLRRKK